MVKALDIYQKMADLNPSNVGFRLKLADLYIKEGLKKEAAKAHLEAANVHMSKDAFQDARQIFEKVLTLDPNNKEVYHKAGIVYFKEGKFVEACKAFKPAFEADPANQELIDLYLEALSKADRAAEAEEVLKKLLSQDAARMDLREKLYHLYRSKKEYDKALTEAAAIADAKVENREHDEAVEILKGFVSENPANIAGRRKLSEIYGNIRREEDAARELFQIADLLTAGGDRDGARETIVRAAEIAPDMAEARQRLETLEAAPVAPPLEEQAPVEQVVTPFEAVTPAPTIAQPVAEEDPAIAEAFTEIDVLIKYGLAGKAVEQLEGLTGKFPESLQVRARLRDLYREQGNTKKAVEYALLLADLYSQRGMSGQAEAALRDALEIEPNNSAVMARLGISPAPEAQPFPPPLTEEAAFPGPAFGEQPPASAEEFAAHTGEGPAIEWQPPAPEITEEAFAETPADIREDLIIQISKQASVAREPLAQEIDISEVWAEAEFFYQQGLFDEARKHYEKILEVAPSDKRALGRIAEISREKEEVQEFSKLAEAVEGLEDFVPSGAPEQEAAVSASDEEAVRTLMEEIKQLQQEQKAATAPKKKSAPPPKKKAEPRKEERFGFEAEVGKRAEKKEKGGEEEFFDLGAEFRAGGEAAPSKREDISDEFFDLAAELRDELGGAAFPEKQAASAEEQSLDDIFEEFKKGVAEQEGRADSDTHYNLGIAYKEMGLLDEAIAEFMLTLEGEPKFIESQYMLGLCYMEHSDYHKAIAEIGNALNYSESLSGDAGERVGMHYDLALAYQGAGNMDEAMSQFQKVAKLDPGYLDTAAKLKEMEKGEFISLDQLKEDIEKEISAKFFEEGERIEREEKIRKNEKMKS